MPEQYLLGMEEQEILCTYKFKSEPAHEVAAAAAQAGVTLRATTTLATATSGAAKEERLRFLVKGRGR